MAVGLRLKFPGGTQEQYLAIHDHLDVENRPPEGLIFHSSGPIDGAGRDRFLATTRNAFDQFAQSKLMPATAELGDRAFPEPPEIREFPVHNYTVPTL